MRALTFGFDNQELRARYDRLFEASPFAFIQQSTYWANAVCAVSADTPVFLICESEGEDIAGLPLYLFEHTGGNVLTSVPSRGPLGGVFVRHGVTGARREAAYRLLIAHAIEVAREHECLALSVITNPFDPDVEIYRDALRPTFELENFTQFVPLRNVVSAARRCLSRNLRRAHAAGFELSYCESDDELETFHCLLARRYREFGVEAPSRAFMFSLRRHLEPRGKWSLLLARKDGRLVSGLLGIRHHRVMDALHLAFDSAYRQSSPNFLTVERTLLDAAREGVGIFNWQSSPNRQSGVYRFKRQWGSVERTYSFLARLFCPVDRINAIGLTTLRWDYAWHFVVPYRGFDDGFAGTHYEKDRSGSA